VLGAALGRAFRLLAIGSVRHHPGRARHPCAVYIVYQATPKDPVVLGGVILSMLTVGMVAACIPARHLARRRSHDAVARRIGAAGN